MPEQRVVLVTGASSGIGRAIASLLAQKDLRVFGTSRRPSDLEPIPGVEVLPLDVRSDESANACIGTVCERAGRLDVLINNAGYELGGAIEEVSLEEARAQFETNFFGVMRMVRAVLPAMRRRRNGQIINIGSLSGLTPMPFMGVYSASKYAVEGYTEILRHEVKPFHIKVSLVEPGFIHTHLGQSRQYAAQGIGEYDPWRARLFEAYQQYEDKAPSPSLVAECVQQIVESPSPKLRYIVGKDATSVTRLRRWMPASVYEQGIRDHFHLDGKK